MERRLRAEQAAAQTQGVEWGGQGKRKPVSSEILWAHEQVWKVGVRTGSENRGIKLSSCTNCPTAPVKHIFPIPTPRNNPKKLVSDKTTQIAYKDRPLLWRLMSKSQS